MKTIILFGILLICCPACKKEQSSQPLHGGELVRITVRSDTVAQVISVSDTGVVTYPTYLTIDSLFSIIRNSRNDSLVIRYNDQYGYPEYLDVNPQLHPVDAGFLYETSNLHVP